MHPVLAASNFLVPNGTFIVELVAFLLVVGALAKWVLPVVNRSMDERQATIRQALQDAEEARRRAEEAEARHKELLDQARREAREIVEEANKTGERLRAERRRQAEEEYERTLERARDDIESEVRRASEELRRQLADLVVAVVERVLGEGLDTGIQRELIDRTIAQVEAQASAPQATGARSS